MALIKQKFAPVPLEVTEILWRDSELDRTDKFMSVSDYPYKEAMVAYRQALRDWTDSEDFPTVRPTLEVGNE